MQQQDNMGKLTCQPRLSHPDASEQITKGYDTGFNMADDKRSEF